jgi:hypothetical protein
MSLTKNFKTRAIKFFATLLLAGLITCAATFVWGYYNRPLLFPENTGTAGYNVDPGSKHNILHVKLNGLEGNHVSGEAILYFEDEAEAERAGKAKNRLLRFPQLGSPFGMSDDFFMRPIGDDNPSLKVGDGVKLFCPGDTAAYPFDDYVLGFTADVRYSDGNLVNDMARVKDLGALVLLDLPNTFRVTKEKNTAKVTSPFMSEFTGPRPLGENEFLFYIDRPLWLKAYVVGALLFLLVPLLLILRTPINNWALDLIATLVSVATVRTAIFGMSLDIHWIDIWLGAVVLLMGSVPLVKVLMAKGE